MFSRWLVGSCRRVPAVWVHSIAIDVMWNGWIEYEKKKHLTVLFVKFRQLHMIQKKAVCCLTWLLNNDFAYVYKVYRIKLIR